MSYKDLISSAIKRKRLENKLTQEKFAELINMSTQGIRNIEQGRYLPTDSTIDKICEVLKIEPVELLMPVAKNNVSELRKIINLKMDSFDIEKLIKVNNMLDII